ncbi:MAG: RICIN domain-containing protein [Candidatus Limnocylindrales bacterium]
MRTVSAAIAAAAMITAGVALNVAPVSAATAANTLTVNANTTLRSVTHVASGSLYGLANASQPSSSVASAIKPSEFVQKPQGGAQQPDGDILTVAPTASAVGAKLVSRFIDYYSGWPYSFNSSNWLSVVDNQISQYKASSYYGIISAYAPFNEPDNTWNTSNGTFNDIWVKTYNEIRAKDSSKPIQGPSFSDNISGNSRAPSMQAFLQNAKNTNTVPDILAWHELSNAAKIAGDISTVQGIEDSLGISRRPIDIEEYASPSEVGIPGPLVGYVAKFERLGVTHAELPFWNQSGALGDTLTGKGGSPNAAYWMYTWYAAMSGNMVQVNAPAQTGIDGFAAVPSAKNQVSIVVGGCSGSCAVTVNQLNSLSLGSTVSVKIEQVVSKGRTTAVSGASTISTTNYTPSNGTISVPITMNTSDAWRITITAGSGGGSTPTPTRTSTGTGASGLAGVYQISNYNSGLRLDTQNSGTAQGTLAVQATASSSSTTQKWTLVDAGSGQYKIKNNASSLVLGISGMSTSDGASALIWGDTGTADHLWTLVSDGSGHYKIKNVNSGKVLGVTNMSTSSGAQVVQWSDSGTADHLWTFTKIG